MCIELHKREFVAALKLGQCTLIFSKRNYFILDGLKKIGERNNNTNISNGSFIFLMMAKLRRKVFVVCSQKLIQGQQKFKPKVHLIWAERHQMEFFLSSTEI